MLYEAFLLFSVVFVCALLFDLVTQSRHAMTLRHVRQFWLFLVIGAYFVYFWTCSGQTLAMKTWRIQVRSSQKNGLSVKQALVRYLLAWMLFLPGMAIGHLLQLTGWQSLGLIGLGMVAWLSPTLLHGDAQFLHDRLARTQLVHVPKEPAHLR